MISVMHYESPLGNILLAADEIGLTGLWFEGAKNFADNLPNEAVEQETGILLKACSWLDVYFAGNEPDFLPPLHLIGSPFRKSVWKILFEIPYGKTMTYEEIAKKNGIVKMSAQAVGGAVGHNEVSSIVPCHRVVGKNGSLTGYAGGLKRKL